MNNSSSSIFQLFNELRLRILSILYRHGGLRASELLSLLSGNELTLQNLLYHLNILERKGLLLRDEDKRYFITDFGKHILEKIEEIEDMVESESKIRILMSDYPYIQILSKRILQMLIQENFNLKKPDEDSILKELVDRLNFYRSDLITKEVINALIISLLIEKHKEINYYNLHVSKENELIENKRINILQYLISNINELKEYLHLIYISSLDFFYEKSIDLRMDMARISYTGENEKENILVLYNSYFKIKNILNSLSTGILLNKSDSFINIQNKFYYYFKMLLQLLSFDNDYFIKFAFSDINLLRPNLIKNYDGKILIGCDLNLESRVNDIINCIHLISSYLKEIPFLSFFDREDSSGGPSCLDYFNPNADEWVVMGSISLNMPRLVVESNYNEDKLKEKLFDLFKLSHKLALLKESKIKKNNFMNVFMAKFFINIIGLFESIFLLTNKTINDNSSYKLLRNLLIEMDKIVEEIDSENLLGLSSVRDYEASKAFSDYDLKQNDISFKRELRFALKKHGYSFGIIPSWISLNFKQNLSLQGPLLQYFKGGYTAELFIQPSLIEENSLKEIFEQAFLNYKLRTIKISTIACVCSRCYNQKGGQNDLCKQCGTKDSYYVLKDDQGLVHYVKTEDFYGPSLLYLLD
jgi:DNA-binding transcriptional ArsR family regulator